MYELTRAGISSRLSMPHHRVPHIITNPSRTPGVCLHQSDDGGYRVKYSTRATESLKTMADAEQSELGKKLSLSLDELAKVSAKERKEQKGLCSELPQQLYNCPGSML